MSTSVQTSGSGGSSRNAGTSVLPSSFVRRVGGGGWIALGSRGARTSGTDGTSSSRGGNTLQGLRSSRTDALPSESSGNDSKIRHF